MESVCAWMPCDASTTRIAPSHAASERDTSYVKSTWPGVSIRFSSYVWPSGAVYDMRTALSLMVMPRSRSRSSVSSTCSFISRFWSMPVASIRRSASVDLP